MNGMRSLTGISGLQSRRLEKRPRTSILEIDSWMPSRIEAISPFVDRLMVLIEGSQCVLGEEPSVELALREALANAVLHGNQERGVIKVHVRCRCEPLGEISIVVTDQGKGFDFRRAMGDGFDCGGAGEHGHGLSLMKAYMDNVHFEHGGSEVHMCKRARSRLYWE